MNCLLLSMAAALILGSNEVLTASLPTKEVISDNIKINLIEYESDLIEGLIPPVPDALNYYNIQSQRSQPENPYVVEISRNYLKVKVNGFPTQNIKLTREETEGIQKLSLSIVELLNSSKLASGTPEKDFVTSEWSELNPVIVLTNSGISLQFLNTSEKEIQAVETTTEDKRVLWDFLAKYAKNIFQAKLKELKISNKFAEEVDSPPDQSDNSPFSNFVNLLWRMMMFSVHYAEMTFGGWTTTSSLETAAPEVEPKIRTTTGTLFAFEELSPFHEFPSQEFQFRRKDVDSIFYGRGVI